MFRVDLKAPREGFSVQMSNFFLNILLELGKDEISLLSSYRVFPSNRNVSTKSDHTVNLPASVKYRVKASHKIENGSYDGIHLTVVTCS